MISVDSFLEKKKRLTSEKKVPQPFVSSAQKFHFIWIFECDPNEVLRLRNADNVLNMTSAIRKISPAEHANFINRYALIPRIDFMIVNDEENISIGGVNLCLTDRGLEIGKYIGESRYLGRGIAKEAMFSFLNFLREEFHGIEILARTRRDNSRNIHLNSKLGFSLCDDLGDEFILMKLKFD